MPTELRAVVLTWCSRVSSCSGGDLGAVLRWALRAEIPDKWKEPHKKRPQQEKCELCPRTKISRLARV